MAQLGFYFNMNNCTGCKCCVLACKEKHNLEVGYNYRKVTYCEGGIFPQVWAATLSMGCNHCAICRLFAHNAQYFCSLFAPYCCTSGQPEVQRKIRLLPGLKG